MFVSSQALMGFIPEFFMKREASLQLLSKIFETALLLKELPYDWRTTNISAIHKKGNKSKLSKYHPVTLTCIICKLDHFLAIISSAIVITDS